VTETAADFYRRVLDFADDQRRLPVPDQAGWDIFPFEGDSLRVKPLDDQVLPEPDRNGAGGRGCRRCADSEDRVAWGNDRWTLSPPPQSLGVPFAAILEPREHLDLGDLDEEMAAEMGRIVVRLTRAVEALDPVARLHVNRWGDGGEHLHVWLLGRPAGLLQTRGSCLPIWDDMLPRHPADQAAASLAVAVAALADLP
jgi:hypothetical protein